MPVPNQGDTTPLFYTMRDDVPVGKDAWVWRTGPYQAHAFVYRVWGSHS